jgi:starch synthase
VAEPLRICFVSSELSPFAKTGGLGDVSAALARFLARGGHDVRPFLPLYSALDTRGQRLVPVEFLRDVPLAMGSRTLSFTLYTTPLPGAPGSLYLVHCPALYDRPGLYTSDPDEGLRFAFLSRAAIESCQRMGWSPHLFHCNDWHTALVPLYLRALYSWDRLFAATQTLLTIHNVGYQGIFGAQILADLGLTGAASWLHQEDLAAGRVNFLKTGVLYAGVLTTVSRTHAREIRSERYGMGLDALLRARADHLVGITNGIDYGEWDPETDPHLPHHYSAADLAGKAADKRHLLDGFGLGAEEGVPLLGVVSRLTSQKGFDLCFDVLPELLGRRDLRLAVLGSGEARYEGFFARLQAGFPGRVGFYRGYSEPLAHLIEAGADAFLMPSRYEPCGLNQMFSQRYGTPPVVRATGGLADTVEPYDPAAGSGTGFLFEHFTPEGLRWALEAALDTFRDPQAWGRLVRNGMARDFSWETQIERYVALYRALVEGRV